MQCFRMNLDQLYLFKHLNIRALHMQGAGGIVRKFFNVKKALLNQRQRHTQVTRSSIN